MALTAQSKAQLDAMAVAGGTADANGHAYYADNPTQLAAALAAIPADIISRTYSFTVASVSSSRITDENFLYEASFTPVNSDPFWRGYLKKYNLNADGTLGTVNWEAGSILAAQDYTTRNIYTSNNGSLITFDTSISRSRLDVPDNATRECRRGVHPGKPHIQPRWHWKLGDIFHSTPINVGTPIAFFEDLRDQNYTSYTCNGTTVLANAFDQFRCDNPRTSANGLRLIVAGANDGQFHAFKTADGSETVELRPPQPASPVAVPCPYHHSFDATHVYLVDGPVTVADVWWKSAGGTDDGTTKVKTDWHTMVIFGEGDGRRQSLELRFPVRPELSSHSMTPPIIITAAITPLISPTPPPYRLPLCGTSAAPVGHKRSEPALPRRSVEQDDGRQGQVQSGRPAI